jgi:hypothetical protein
MLAFDCQMKRLGFSGNQAQIVLGLEGQLSEFELADRIYALKERFPILGAIIKRGILNWHPYWELSNGKSHSYPYVRRHHAENDRDQQRIKRDILNRRLDTRRGEMFCFDLVYSGNSDVELIMTWSHMLMDAHGAEYFLAMIGRSVIIEDNSTQAALLAGSYTDRIPVGSRWQQARKSFQRVDELASNPPISLYNHINQTLASKLDYRIVSFTRSQTRVILSLAEKCGGFLNESAYFSAAAMGEFCRLMQSRSIFPSGYVVPVSIDLRKKGTRLPVFSNQSATLLYGFEPEELWAFDIALASFSRQTQAAIRDDLIASNVSAMELGRFIPSRLYSRKIRQAFKGEIASLVFANPGKVFSNLSTFMGLSVKSIHHVPTIVVPPGMGIVFYTFSNQLQITLIYVESMITSEEAEGFLENVGSHLLNGKLI